MRRLRENAKAKGPFDAWHPMVLKLPLFSRHPSGESGSEKAASRSFNERREKPGAIQPARRSERPRTDKTDKRRAKRKPGNRIPTAAFGTVAYFTV
jgi:hypothetical protein